jgi:hypothetical protein
MADVLAELEQKLADGPVPDYVVRENDAIFYKVVRTKEEEPPADNLLHLGNNLNP